MSRVPVTYTASSGNVYNLQADGKRIRRADFHTWGYDPVGTSRQFGIDLRKWTRDAATYDLTLVFSGPLAQRRQMIKTIHADFENDIRTMSPGRITWGSYYIDCYVVKSDTHPETSNCWYTANDITIYCPYPFWISPLTVTETSGRVEHFTNDTKIASEYKLTMYGPGEAFAYITVGYSHHAIAFRDGSLPMQLATGERIEIDSKARTCLKYDASNNETNVYANLMESSYEPPDYKAYVYDRIPGGPGDFQARNGVLTLYRERSTPKYEEATS